MKDGQHIEPGAEVTIDEAELIKEIKNDLEFAHTKAKPFLDIMVTLKLEHDNAINPDDMPTRSKMSLPYKFAQVEEALGKTHEYMWPPTSTIEILPAEEDVTLDQARNVERGLYHMAKDRMQCADATLPTERDCVNVGLGYGIVEPFTYQKLERNTIAIEGEDGKIMDSTVEMGLSELLSSLRYRYITPGQVVPYPDGYTTNGPGRSSTIFFLDFMGEDEFEALVTDLKDQAETLDFDVAQLNDQDIEDIVRKAKTGTLDNIPEGWFTHVKKLGGIDYKKLSNADQTAKATIPILKVYRENEHLWFANGEKLMYRQAARVQTFRCPILRMCAVRDGLSWFPYSTAEAMRDVNFNRNVWLNMIFDIMTWSANRPLVVSSTEHDENLTWGPNETIITTAPDARTGAAFLQPPGIGADTMQVGQIMDDKAAEIAGTKDFMQKNYSRGGQHAFNDLLNSARGRERIAGAVIESGFYKDLFEQILVYMQIAGIGFEGNIRSFDEKKGEEEMAFLAVDSDDFKHSFALYVSMDKKHTATEFSITDRIAIFREKKQDPGVDLYELDRFLFGNDTLLHRISKPKNKVEAMQAEDREDQRAASQLGIQRAQQGATETPELAGAELGGAPGMI